MNRYELWTPLFWQIPHETLNPKELKKPHIWKAQVWRNHRKIDEMESKNKRAIQKWIKDEGYKYMYDNGECMIYIKINNTYILYWAFMKNKYYLE